MTELDQKRKQVMSVFANLVWHNKVRRMSKDQLVAMHSRLKAQNKI